MGHPNEADGKNSLVGEFMLAFAKAPEHIQEAIMIYGIKNMMVHFESCIAPYPMLSHMTGILNEQGVVDLDKSSKKGGDSNAS
jgi:hypothetical protein